MSKTKTKHTNTPANAKSSTRRHVSRPKAKKNARTPVDKEAAKPRPSKSEVISHIRPGSKLEIIVGLLTRKEGCTAADVMSATDWPSVSMPQQAKAAGLKLKKVKDGRVTRYRAG